MELEALNATFSLLDKRTKQTGIYWEWYVWACLKTSVSSLSLSETGSLKFIRFMNWWLFWAAPGLHLWQRLRMTDILCESCSTVHQHCVAIKRCKQVLQLYMSTMSTANSLHFVQSRSTDIRCQQFISAACHQPTAAAGYLSRSMGLKFSDVPNGLAAISKVQQATFEESDHGMMG